MGLFSTKQKKVNWKEMQKLVDMQVKANRTNLSGPFGSWDWITNPDGTMGQKWAATPGVQKALDRLVSRGAGEGLEDYHAPSQFGQMLDASMAHQMSRQGIGQGNPTPESQGFGPPSGSRPGLNSSAWVPPPPPTVAPPNVPPPGPPGGMPGPGGMPPGIDLAALQAQYGAPA